MTKTPDEIKKGLEVCGLENVSCNSVGRCPYESEFCDYGGVLKADVIDLIRQLEAQVPKWISVEERLPEPKEDVALYIRCGDVSFIRTGWRMGNGQFICPNDSLSCYEVTHWMPLPEPPTKG